MIDRHVAEVLHEHVGPVGVAAPGVASMIIAVSGGIDSTVLAHAINRVGYSAVIAHVNYGLRPSAADDERLVREMASALGWTLRVYRAEPQRLTHGDSLQDEARRQRYDFLREVADEQRVGWVCAGHHRDDQAETVILQLLRGAGIEGLAGMPLRRRIRRDSDVQLLRPLLQVPREAIKQYANESGIRWNEDPSNEVPKYLRNVVRLEVMPLLEKYFGDSVSERVTRAANLLRGYWEHSLEPDLYRRFSEVTEGGKPFLSLEPLCQQPAVWQGRIVLEAMKRWLPGAPQRYSVVQQILELPNSQVGRQVALEGGIIWRERDGLYFDADGQGTGWSVAQVEVGEKVVVQEGLLRLERLSEPPDDLRKTPSNVAYFDADVLESPLLLRPWSAGDRIQPLGMTGTKTVSDLLTDEKVPSHGRDDVLVLESGGEIVWVVNYQISETAKVREGTTEVVRATFTPSDA